ncbi:type II secretion system secretin GspD [Lysobacter enzymogenes]|uniref:type II secretion system secretin GspD n=1 Tax=Lysobacter enzymogenes TaxID=69 RepID=UPI001A973206|nr:type II secretion system secretin GspD [Lysobacter enzymogenes]QQP98563.1 type II secretion system secretin GspD [Lysobacter enzymogenes]
MKQRTQQFATHALAAAIIATQLASCASVISPKLKREGDPRALNGTGGEQAGVRIVRNGVEQEPLSDKDGEEGPKAQIRRGTGQVINRGVAAKPPPGLPGTTGTASFNFEGESLHAVVKAILGEMLGQNYVIAPGVQGTVTLATPKQVNASEAMNLLEMVLSWNNARLIYSGGRYNIVPADQALAGNVSARTGEAANARGFEVRTVPLKYVSATEMEKILKPYARPNAIVNVDNARNVVTVGGTRQELENYLRTIEVFDVDWLSGMSVGVFPLQSGKASKVVADLEKVFGEQSKSPVSGMFRFMPIEGANAVMVITPQAEYLDDIKDWLDRIDSAGDGVQLYTQELKYIKAKDLADRLAEVFGAGRSGGGGGGEGSPSLMPGLESTEVRDNGNGTSSADIGKSGSDSGSGLGSSSGGGLGAGASLGQRQAGNGAVTLEVDGAKVGVAAVEETNSILVRSTPQAWKSIRNVIEKLDVMPMQVHIEAQVAEVTLTSGLQYGVQWFLEQAAADNGFPNLNRRTNPNVPSNWSTIAGSIGGKSGPGLAWTLIKNDAAAVLTALDQVTDVRILQTPSVFVRNNAEATLNVGTRIPIESVSVNTGVGNNNTYSQVQYLDTGVILKVRPRVSRDGMVFLDIVQEVSSAGPRLGNSNNVTIDTKKLKTEAAVQSGETVLLAGLINDKTDRGSKGLPGLSRIPVLGGLFGNQASATERRETIILLTPTLVRNPQESRNLTDEYGRRFRAMEPLNPKPKKK